MRFLRQQLPEILAKRIDELSRRMIRMVDDSYAFTAPFFVSPSQQNDLRVLFGASETRTSPTWGVKV
jgi:hypothetical protein